MTTAMEKAVDYDNGDGKSRGRWQQQWRKLQTTTSGVEEASDVSIDGEGSCGPIPRQRSELHMKVVAGKGTMHESYNDRIFRLVCRRQRKHQTCLSAAERATHRGSGDKAEVHRGQTVAWVLLCVHGSCRDRGFVNCAQLVQLNQLMPSLIELVDNLVKIQLGPHPRRLTPRLRRVTSWRFIEACRSTIVGGTQASPHLT